MVGPEVFHSEKSVEIHGLSTFCEFQFISRKSCFCAHCLFFLEREAKVFPTFASRSFHRMFMSENYEKLHLVAEFLKSLSICGIFFL